MDITNIIYKIQIDLSSKSMFNISSSELSFVQFITGDEIDNLIYSIKSWIDDMDDFFFKKPRLKRILNIASYLEFNIQIVRFIDDSINNRIMMMHINRANFSREIFYNKIEAYLRKKIEIFNKLPLGYTVNEERNFKILYNGSELVHSEIKFDII